MCQSYLSVVKLAICVKAIYLSKLSIYLSIYLYVKAIYLSKPYFRKLSMRQDICPKQLAHLVPVLRKFLVKLPLIIITFL